MNTGDSILKDCYKTYTLDQDKAASPGETVTEVKRRLSGAGLDVIQATERIDSGRLDIPVFISRCGRDALSVMPTAKQMGKGATPDQAEASAVMEMVERFSFFHFLNRTRFQRAVFDQVEDQALPLEHLAASVHHDPEDLGRARQALEGLPLDWIPAYNLTQGRSMLIPLNWFYEINEFNGTAAGNTLEEALIQGLCEVVERHVSALVARGRMATPDIDLESLNTPVARELAAKFHNQGIRLWTKDFSLDMGLATVGALAYDPATFPQLSEIVFTAGTATDPEKALIRALTEVAQLGGDFISRSNFLASGLPKFTRLDQAGYVTESGLSSVSISTLPDIASANIKTEIEAAVSALSLKGFDVYVVDVTHPEVGVPAIYAIMPGAHFRERAAGSSIPFFAAKLLASNAGPRQFVQGLTRLKKLYPDGYYLYFHEGQFLLESGEFEEALGPLTKALDLDPTEEDRAGILTYIGLAHKEMEHYEPAVEYLEASAALDSERRDTFNLLGFCRFKTGDYEKAVQAFQNVLRLDPGSGIDHANLGVNYARLGRVEEARRCFVTALELDPALEWVKGQMDNLG